MTFNRFRLASVTAAMLALVTTIWSGSPAMAGGDYAPLPMASAGQETAIFAGGCFWCVESDLDHVPGVIATTSGYTGGSVVRPSYKQVTYKDTGHYEAVHVVYDPAIVSYEALLTAFWHSVDPTDAGGQFCDRGASYRTAIFVKDNKQRTAAQASKAAIASDLPKPVATMILNASAFYPAETYHQDYYLKNPLRYAYYRNGCGRNRTVQRVWGNLAYKGIPKS